jgi:hypothetical protein
MFWNDIPGTWEMPSGPMLTHGTAMLRVRGRAPYFHSALALVRKVVTTTHWGLKVSAGIGGDDLLQFNKSSCHTSNQDVKAATLI